MSEKTGAERACKDPNPIIDGRKANVNLAYLGAKPRSKFLFLSIFSLVLISRTLVLFLLKQYIFVFVKINCTKNSFK